MTSYTLELRLTVGLVPHTRKSIYISAHLFNQYKTIFRLIKSNIQIVSIND